MPVYHVVLFRLKPGTPQAKVEELKAAGKAMVGQVPGLQRIDFGPPVLATRAHGFDIGLVAILDKKEDIKVYAEHPAHLKVHALREAVCDDTLAYDLEF